MAKFNQFKWLNSWRFDRNARFLPRNHHAGNFWASLCVLKKDSSKVEFGFRAIRGLHGEEVAKMYICIKNQTRKPTPIIAEAFNNLFDAFLNPSCAKLVTWWIWCVFDAMTLAIRAGWMLLNSTASQLRWTISLHEVSCSRIQYNPLDVI